jgi:XRE family transcriptional regulator, regulator of sulfur utilization
VRDLARVGRDLKVRRKALGLSLDDAARSSGVERSALAKIERGANPNPTVGTLAKVAHALGGRVAIGFEPFRE